MDGVEALKIDDTKPPPPIESEPESVVGGKITLTKDEALRGKNFQLRKQVKTLKRENEELKKETEEEMKKAYSNSPAHRDSAWGLRLELRFVVFIVLVLVGIRTVKFLVLRALFRGQVADVAVAVRGSTII